MQNSGITEHGSAAILRDHVALFKDQLAILKEKVALLASEKDVLKVENEALKNENVDLKKRIRIHDEPTRIKAFLDESKLAILRLLFKQDKLSAEDISQTVGYPVQATKFHLEELKRNKMVSEFPPSGRQQPLIWRWTLDQEGRRYLIENKSIS